MCVCFKIVISLYKILLYNYNLHLSYLLGTLLACLPYSFKPHSSSFVKLSTFDKFVVEALMANRGGLLGAALIGTGGVCISLEFCELFVTPLTLLLFTLGTGAFSDEAELL